MESNKQLLRAWAKAKRLALPKNDIELKSGLIAENLFNFIRWSNLRTVSTYSSIDSLNEVRTDDIIRFIRQQHPDIKLETMSQSQSYQTGGTKFDLIIVPVLAYDSRGHRLGWGGGFYDRFLADQTQALKVGLCFRSGLIRGALPVEPHDIALDKIITEVS